MKKSRSKIKDESPIKEKLFSIKKISQAKINYLQSKLHVLNYQEMVWLSRMEDFYTQYEYLTEKQLTIMATARAVEAVYRNSEGLKDWDNAIAAALKGIDYDLADEDAADATELLG